MSGIASRAQQQSELEEKIRDKAVPIVEMAMHLRTKATVLLREQEGGLLIVEANPWGYGTVRYYDRNQKVREYSVDYSGIMVELGSGFYSRNKSAA